MCKKCNTWNVDTAKYCRNCGNLLSGTQSKFIETPNGEESQQSQSSTPVGDEQQSSVTNSERWAWTIVCVSLFIIISVATGGIGSISIIPFAAAINYIWNNWK